MQIRMTPKGMVLTTYWILERENKETTPESIYQRLREDIHPDRVDEIQWDEILEAYRVLDSEGFRV